MSNGTEIINDILGDVKLGKQTLVEVSQEMVGEAKSIKFAIENRQVQPEQPELPPKMESPKRAHIFHDADGFAAYLAKYKTENTVVMVDVSEQVVYAIIDEVAKEGFEVVTMQPVVHPVFEPWQEILEESAFRNIRKFVNFLSENRRSIAEPNGKQLVRMLGQVQVSRKTTLQRGFGTHSVNGIICEMDIMGEQKNEQLELPEIITIEAPLYLATDPVQLEVDLTIDANDSEVFVKCSSADLMQKRIESFEAMLEKVKAIDDVVVTLGTPTHNDWKYLKAAETQEGMPF